MPRPKGQKPILDNRRARFHYELGEKFEAGLALVGSEVKILRNGGGDLTDGWVDVRRGEAFLKGVYLPPLAHAALPHAERRDRKLLLHAREIEALEKAVKEHKVTLIPTQLYWKDGRAKVEIAFAKGKKLADKRATEAKRDWQRQKARLMRERG